MSSVAQYLKEIVATTRPTRRMSVLQKACNALPPGELTELYLQLPKIGGRALCKAAPYYKYMTAPARQRAAKGPQLVKRPSIDRYSFFETQGTAPAQKTLYILFGGNFGQFLIPLSAILYVLPHAPKDVAVMSPKQKHMFYLNGVEGMGRTAFEVARSLKAQYNLNSYARVVVIGTSSGGVFAHQIAGFLEANCSISFAAAHSEAGLIFGMKENHSLSAFDPICACRPHTGERMVNLFAAQNDYDYRCSSRIKAARPELHEVCLPHRAHHNVLQAVVETHSARLFINMALAKNDSAIRLVSAITKSYGIHIVRRLRHLLRLV